MRVVDIYERVCQFLPTLEQRRFLNFVNDSVVELEQQYYPLVVESGKTYVPLAFDSNIADAEINVRPLYLTAIVCDVRYLAAPQAEDAAAFKQEFFRQAQGAFFKYWHDTAHGRKVGEKCVCGDDCDCTDDCCKR